MCIFTILAGMISGMNSFVDKTDDLRLNINDFYMSSMMNGLMFIFMAIYYKSIKLFIVGFVITIVTFIFLRYQIFVDEYQYTKSMIPHHSMAIMMSKKLLLNKSILISDDIKLLANNIIDSQENEIEILKKNTLNFF